MKDFEADGIMGGIYGDGIICLRNAVLPDIVDRLYDDILALYEDALLSKNGLSGRGLNRHYVEIHPENLHGFARLASHPWIHAVCEVVLGPYYKIVGVGFESVNPLAVDQPWHRDFPAPVETMIGRKLTSLVFNITTIEVFEDMGPFEIACGTQWDSPEDIEHGMFPPSHLYDRYNSRTRRILTKSGDITAHTPLVFHRGTANPSSKSRHTLSLIAEAPGAGNSPKHDLQLTYHYAGSLQDQLKDHLAYRLVSTLEPIDHMHTIEELMMGIV